MATVVNMHEAKTELSRLVERALKGEEVIIARAGVPVARLTPLQRSGVRNLGQWKGRVRMADDFDFPLSEDELRSWEGSVRALLDTHTILWALADDKRLSPRVRELVQSLENDLVVSAVSAWEIAVKVGLGKLEVPPAFEEAVVEAGFAIRSIGFAECEVLRTLAPHHRDPFDRMLVAQALVDGLPIVTKDAAINEYPVQTIW